MMYSVKEKAESIVRLISHAPEYLVCLLTSIGNDAVLSSSYGFAQPCIARGGKSLAETDHMCAGSVLRTHDQVLLAGAPC